MDAWGWVRARGATHGYSICRWTLDPIFRRLAADTPGVYLMLGWTADDLLGPDGAVHGLKIRDRSGRPRDIRTRLVVGADGNHSRPAELAGAKTTTRPNNRLGYFAYYRDLPLASGTRSQMWLAGWDVAYAFPNNDGLTVLACMPVKERLPDFQRDLEGSFAAFFATLPDTPPIAQGARASKLMGIVDYPLYERPVAPRPGLALARDAALTSDPLWGVGCGWAFQSAEWLVEDTAPALADGDTKGIAKGLARYRRRHRKELRGHQFLIADFARVRDLNPLERLMFSAASRDARMAEHVDAFASRLIPVRRFLAPRALGRTAWVNLRHAARRRG